MNSNDQPKQPKWINKLVLRFTAVVSIIVSILLLMLSIKMYVGGGFGWLEQNPTNPVVIKSALNLLALAYFRIIPAMAVLLIGGSALLWTCSQKLLVNLVK